MKYNTFLAPNTRNSMDAKKTIAEIELLEHLLTLSAKRPLQISDWKAPNQKHDETYANRPWFRLGKRDGRVSTVVVPSTVPPDFT